MMEPANPLFSRTLPRLKDLLFKIAGIMRFQRLEGRRVMLCMHSISKPPAPKFFLSKHGRYTREVISIRCFNLLKKCQKSYWSFKRLLKPPE